jgi:hypothetical protein
MLICKRKLVILKRICPLRLSLRNSEERVDQNGLLFAFHRCFSQHASLKLRRAFAQSGVAHDDISVIIDVAVSVCSRDATFTSSPITL